ncbi:MAG: outer membrane beta-barrel protein [Terracidiphilus sp.]|jgi:hypothetical protein
MRSFNSFGKERRVERGPRFGGRAIFGSVLVAVFLAGLRPASGQVAPAAESGGLKLTVGATATGYSLDYGERKMLGVAAIADADTNRRIGIEGEAQWLIFHQTANVHTTTYLIGPRYHLNFGRLQPYAKGLVGFGRFNYPYNLGQDKDLVIAPGGGVDFRLTRRIRLRLADFEYQYWPQFHFGALSSYGVSSGIRVRIF